MRKGENEHKMPDKMDIKGSGEISDLADYAFTIWKRLKKQEKLRDNPDDEEWLRKSDGALNYIKNRYDPEHPSIPLWFSGKPFSFKQGRRAPVPQLIEPSSKELESGYIP